MKKIFYLSILFFLLQQSTFLNNQLLGQTLIVAQTGCFSNDTMYHPAEEWYKINDSIMSYWNCCDSSDGLKFAVFDSISCTPWIHMHRLRIFDIQIQYMVITIVRSIPHLHLIFILTLVVAHKIQLQTSLILIHKMNMCL